MDDLTKEFKQILEERRRLDSLSFEELKQRLVYQQIEIAQYKADVAKLRDCLARECVEKGKLRDRLFVKDLLQGMTLCDRVKLWWYCQKSILKNKLSDLFSLLVEEGER